MPTNEQRIAYLLNRHMSNAITSEEKNELMNWLSANDSSRFADIAVPLLFTGETQNDTSQQDMQLMLAEILRSDKAEAVQPVIRTAHRVHFLKTSWFRFAASIIIIAGIATYFWQSTQKKSGSDASMLAENSGAPAPSSLLATITLSNGRQINLDSMPNGTVATEGDITIEKLNDGRIIYKGMGDGKMIYNTLSVPKGSKIGSLTLSDGTVVFLNSASSLKYPVAFNGNERRVQITGEAYFEVAKDKNKQFVVDAGSLTTEVLGTNFNINSYDNEENKEVTLLEGRVRISYGDEQLTLEPGQQAQAEEKLEINNTPDIEDVMAWKNGIFHFDNAGIEELMRELERWYDLDIVYKDKPSKTFEGTMPRSLNLASVLKILEKTGGVKFEINGRKVIVMK